MFGKPATKSSASWLLLVVFGSIIVILIIFNMNDDIMDLDSLQFPYQQAGNITHKCIENNITIFKELEIRKYINTNTTTTNISNFNQWCNTSDTPQHLHYNQLAKMQLPQRECIETTDSEKEDIFVKCLHKKGIKSILFCGDSQMGTIVDAFGQRLDKFGLLNP